MSKFKAIFFDADGTLVNLEECEKQALVYLFDNIGIVYEDKYQEAFKLLEQWDSVLYEGVPRESIPVYRFKLLFEKININFDNYVKANDLFKIGLANSVALIENANEIMEYLHNKRYMLCVVTNGLIELQRPRIINSNIGRFISHIIVSEEVGVPKPNPLIFNTLLARINLEPNEVVMIGDSLTKDIQGAVNANIKTIWYSPEHHSNETALLPDYEIHDLLQLKEVF